MAAKILILKGDRSNQQSSAYKTWCSLKADGPDQYFLELYSDIAFVIKDGQVRCLSMATGRDLNYYDLVYIRDRGGYEHVRNAIGLYLTLNNRKFINSDVATFPHNSKLAQAIRLAFGGLPVPDSLFVQPCHFTGAIRQFGFGYPLVAKSINGNNGRYNELIQKESELEICPEESLLQEYVPNNFDYRIIVAEKKILSAYKRIRSPDSGTHKNNVSFGGKREMVEKLPIQVEQAAVKAAAVTRRELAGVDILPETGSNKFVVLEVNYNFGMDEVGSEISDQYYSGLAKYLHHKASE